MRLKFLLPLVFFFFIMLIPFTPFYVEGDDSMTVLFHLLGRNPAIQPPYSFYHSGADFLFSFLPSDEETLRKFLMGISFLFNVIMLGLLFTLVFRWLGKKISWKLIGFSFLFLLAVPEYSFQGLLYNSTVIGFSFLLLAHHLVYDSLNYRRIFFASLLFAFGATFRWNIAFYGLVIYGDLVSRYFNRKGLIHATAWGFLSLLFFAFFLFVQGINFEIVAGIIKFQKELTSATQAASLAYMYIQNVSFYTPFLILICAVGFIVSLREQKRLIGLSFLALPCFFLFQTFEAKFTIPYHPFWVLFFFLGLFFLEKKISLWAVAAILFLPWFVGISIFTNQTPWGPGFEIKNASLRDASILVSNSGGIKLNNSSYKLTFLDGFAVPTNEGLRPLGGYAGVLWGGKWRDLLVSSDQEYQKIVQEAHIAGREIIRAGGTAYIETALYRQGFSSTDLYNNQIYPGVGYRRFTNREGQKIGVYLISHVAFYDPKIRTFLEKKMSKNGFIVFSNYSSLISDLQRILGSTKPLGHFSIYWNN